MLDLLGILFSSIMMFLVILRAIQLDNTQPWFKAPRTGVDDSGLKLTPGRTGGEVTSARRPMVRPERSPRL